MTNKKEGCSFGMTNEESLIPHGAAGKALRGLPPLDPMYRFLLRKGTGALSY